MCGRPGRRCGWEASSPPEPISLVTRPSRCSDFKSDSIAQRLVAAAAAALHALLGAISIDMSPEELGAFVQRELDKWTKVIQAGGIQPERRRALNVARALSLPQAAERRLHDRRTDKETAVAMKRVVTEIGMGTDIRGADYTKAAVRALRDALWHNSLNIADALGKPTDSMQVEVLIGVPKPDLVDKAQVLAVLPHGTGTVKVVEGGLEIFNDAGTSSTVIANAAAIVRLDIA